MSKDVMILTGAGQIGMAIARRIGYGMKIVVGDRSLDYCGANATPCDQIEKNAIPTSSAALSVKSYELERYVYVGTAGFIFATIWDLFETKSSFVM